MRLSFVLFLLLLAGLASAGPTRTGTPVHKVDQGSAEEPDPCENALPGTVLCGRIRVPVG